MNILNVEYDINLLNNLTEYISQNEVKNTPSITVYHQVLKTLKSPEDEKNYIQLKELVKRKDQ